MSHKRQGQLTTSGEWAKHLRPFNRRLYWGRERSAERSHIQRVTDESTDIKLPNLKEFESVIPAKKLSP